jgi:hypothetical protein
VTDTHEERERDVRLHDVLRELPLLDEVFLGMQALNVDAVDGYLEQLEGELLEEYIDRERTPTASALFVSALSQMWVFATYELLRTWRQRVSEVIDWGDTLEGLAGDERDAAIEAKRREIARRGAELRDADARWQVFERAGEPRFIKELRSAVNRTERPFRDIEAARMHLAKHEVPRQRGVFGEAAGYGRIDMETGSIYWMVDLGAREVAVHSRRGLADGLRALLRPNKRILPAAAQELVRVIERESYGVHRVAVTLDDGAEYEGVRVAWAIEVIGVDGYDGVPFDALRVVAVRRDPAPAAAPDDGALF